jgi:hypothetical protein
MWYADVARKEVPHSKQIVVRAPSEAIPVSCGVLEPESVLDKIPTIDALS